jgi:hypothetical protein
MKPYLEAVDRTSYYEELTRDISGWKKLIAYTPQDKKVWAESHKLNMPKFRKEIWEMSVG